MTNWWKRAEKMAGLGFNPVAGMEFASTSAQEDQTAFNIRERAGRRKQKVCQTSVFFV